MKTYTFPHGGIKYVDHSVPAGGPSSTAFLPTLSIIPMIQHTGSRAYPVVTAGEHVTEGMLIGRGQGQGSANVHATLPGRVMRFVSWQMSSGKTNDAVVIHLEGAFEKLGRKEEIFPWHSMQAHDILRVITQYGIVEMEGSGAPVSDLINAARPSSGPLTLVVRCVFDDPWLVADRVLLEERLDMVAEGSAITARAAMAERILLAVSQGDEELGQRFVGKAGTFGIPAQMEVVGTKYPQHNKRELEYALRYCEKKETLSLGAFLILGPATMAAVHDAVKLKKPILERYVAVGGMAVRKPKVLKVRIGTRIFEVFEECGGFAGVPKCVATGSPLSGMPVLNLDEPVVKTTYALFALPEKQTGGRAIVNCISCGECRSVCPVRLDPEALYKTKFLSQGGKAALAMECHGCGCCDVVCPSHIPLSTSIRQMGMEGA